MHVSIVESICLIVFCINLHITKASATTSKNVEFEKKDDSNDHINNIIRWIRDKGGIINAKVEIKKANHILSQYRMVANRNIPANELLIRIPPDCILTDGLPIVGDKVLSSALPAEITRVNRDLTFDLMYDGSGDEEEDLESHDISKLNGESFECDVARNLMKEAKLGSESKFAPYVNYLLVQKDNWSDEGKLLLLDLLGDGLPPYDLTTKWNSECENMDDLSNDEKTKRNKIKLPPKWKNLFIPILDTISHRVGNGVNVKYEMDINKGFSIYASRVIKIGEEVYAAHNLCHECEKNNIDYGTAQVFRDYGIVEKYPQRWFFPKQHLAFEIHGTNTDDKDDTSSKDLFVNWIKTGPRESMKDLNVQLHRLVQLEETNFRTCDGTIPEDEWNTIHQYLQALLTAIKHAVNTVPKVECYENYDFDQYEMLEEIETPYQVVSFKYNPIKDDVCLHLGGIGLARKTDILQQCAKYRPHYHEMFVHYSARFLPEIKRVIWVGGGDSMLLHEIIKYPSLEFVVGLEIDQTVTRKSFQYFGTQPHWDNEKVHWIYGDAAKSLLVLPKEWYGTFDLVLVDLSETVLSLSVCRKLDIMSALGLLLKPEGVLVKNDDYFLQLSEVFNYTLQLEFDISVPVPFTCSQPLIFASNKEFDVHSRKDHNVEVLWDRYIPPMNNTTAVKDDMSAWFAYRKNDIEPDTCQERSDIEQELQSEFKSPGIMMILEAEDVHLDIRQPSVLGSVIEAALEFQGLHIINTAIHTNNIECDAVDENAQIITLFDQGYVVTRTWPELNYCAFDIHLWGSFRKQESIKKALVNTVKSKKVSSYRIVAGGMFGIKSWKDDMKNRGPRFTQPCVEEKSLYGSHIINESPVKPTFVDFVRVEEESLYGSFLINESPVKPTFVDFVLEEILSLIPDDNLKVAVVCGDKNVECKSRDVLEKHEKINEILELSCLDSTTVQDCTESVTKTMLDSVTLDYFQELEVLDERHTDNYFEIGDKVTVPLANVGRNYFGTVNHLAGADGTLDVIYENGKHDFDLEIPFVDHLTKRDILEENMKLRAVIVDPSVSKPMAEIIATIFMEAERREELLSNHTLFIALTPDENLARMNMFQRLQINVTSTDTAVVYSQVYFHQSGKILDMSLLSSGDNLFVERLQSKLATMHQSKFGFRYNIEKIYRNEVILASILGESFSAKDYDTKSSLAQWYSQQSLGRQTLFQLEKFSMDKRVLKANDEIHLNDSVEAYVEDDEEWFAGTVISIDAEDDTFDITFVNEFNVIQMDRHQIRKAFYTSLEHMPMSALDIQNALRVVCTDLSNKEPLQFSDFGDGSVHSVQWNAGSVIVLWDGKNHVDINLFTHDETRDFHDNFVNQFMKQIPCLSVALHDIQPRGIGNVINFKEDIEPRVEPLWV